MFAVIGTFLLAFVLWQSTEPTRNGSDEPSQTPAERANQNLQNRLPNALIDRLGPLRERIAFPKNASLKDLEDRYEIIACPWQTKTLLIDGDIPSRAHHEHAGHDSAHDTGHEPLADEADHTHNTSYAEYFADEGKLTVAKAKDGAITFELTGHAAFDSEFIHYSADRMVYHLAGSDDRMILIGHARLVNDQDKVQLTADKITNRGQTTLAEGNARIRRNDASGKPETISADRLEIDHTSRTVSLAAKATGSALSDLTEKRFSALRDLAPHVNGLEALAKLSQRGARKLTEEERSELLEWLERGMKKLTDEERTEVLEWLDGALEAESTQREAVEKERTATEAAKQQLASEAQVRPTVDSSVEVVEMDLKSTELRLAEARRKLAQAEQLQAGAIPSRKVDELRFAFRQAELDLERQKLLLEEALKRRDDQVKALEIERRAAQLRLDALQKVLDRAESHRGLVPESSLDQKKVSVQQAELEVERIGALLEAARSKVRAKQVKLPERLRDEQVKLGHVRW